MADALYEHLSMSCVHGPVGTDRAGRVRRATVSSTASSVRRGRRGIGSREEGNHQFQRPMSCIAGGHQDASDHRGIDEYGERQPYAELFEGRHVRQREPEEIWRS